MELLNLFSLNLLLIFCTTFCSASIDTTFSQLKQLLHDVEIHKIEQSPLPLQELRFLVDAETIDQSKCSRNHFQELRNYEVSHRFNGHTAISDYIDHCERRQMEYCAKSLEEMIKNGLTELGSGAIEEIDELMFRLKNSNLIRGLVAFIYDAPANSLDSVPENGEAKVARVFGKVENLCSNMMSKLAQALKFYRDDYEELRNFFAYDTRKWLTNFELCEEILNDKELILISVQKLYNKEKGKQSP